MKVSILIDYQVLDHLLRIEDTTYNGHFRDQLDWFKAYCSSGNADVWLAEISEVEMIQGRENPRLDPHQLSKVERKDARKLEIARELGAKRLGYPCSKLSDTYSRLGVSFRLVGPNSASANDLEKCLLSIPDVSPGDARQLVTAVYGHDDADPSQSPRIDFVVTEDSRLRAAIRKALAEGLVAELNKIPLLSVAEFMVAQQAPPGRRADARA